MLWNILCQHWIGHLLGCNQGAYNRMHKKKIKVILCQKLIIKLHIKTSSSETLPDSYIEKSDNQLHHQDQNTKEYIPYSSWLQKMSTREYKKNPVKAYLGRHLWTCQETDTRGDQRLPQTSKGCEKSKFCHTIEKINIKDVKESRLSSN